MPNRILGFNGLQFSCGLKMSGVGFGGQVATRGYVESLPGQRWVVISTGRDKSHALLGVFLGSQLAPFPLRAPNPKCVPCIVIWQWLA